LEFWKLGHLAARFPVGSEIKMGDTLITNGLGGVFPKGLLVGVLQSDPEPDPDQSDILIMAKVLPAENPNLVEEVFVLIRKAEYIITEGN
jgi:rod shape-determining protein MreC